MKKFRNILWGIFFVGIGIVLATNAMGYTNINLFFDGWWTFFIIIPSFIGLFNDDDKTGNLIGILIGLVLLLCAQGVISFRMIGRLAIPAVFVVIGLCLIFKDTVSQKVGKEIKKINQEKKKDASEYAATFSSQDLNFKGQDFKGTSLTAVFGGVKCDLTEANITEDVVINAEAIFGGIEIFLPNDVEVKIKSTPIFGGVTDKSPHNHKEDAKVVYINASCVFGGVDIK